MSVYIFIPIKKAILKRWHFLFVAFICLLLLVLIENLNFELKNIIIDVLRILTFIFFFIYLSFWVYSLSEKEKPTGFLSGQLIFKDYEIVIGNETYKLNEISKITIICEDYEDLYISALMNTPHPKYSAGVSNYFEIKLKNGESKRVKFKQNYENEIIKKNKEKLISYHKQGVIPFLTLIQLLGIEDYNEIQDFKKQLKV